MNREEAVKFNEELKVFMEEQAVELGLDEDSGASLVDQYIEIYPDELCFSKAWKCAGSSEKVFDFCVG